MKIIMSGDRSQCQHVSRINQLDAAALDEELLATLKRNLMNGLEFIQHNWLQSLEPEILSIVKLLIWHYSVNADGATVGQKLFELQYQDQNAQRISRAKSRLLAALCIFLPWGRNRLPKILPEGKDKILDFLDVAFKMGEVINFLIFLHQGQYSSLVERILSIRNSHSRPQEIRQVQYEYVNREMLWNGIAEFISFVIPMIRLRRIKNTLLCMIWPKSVVPSLAEHRTKEDLQLCGVCGETPIAAHDMGCRHVFCYYCIMSSVMADPKFHCPSCHHQADGCDNVRPVSIV